MILPAAYLDTPSLNCITACTSQRRANARFASDTRHIGALGKIPHGAESANKETQSKAEPLNADSGGVSNASFLVASLFQNAAHNIGAMLTRVIT